MGGWRMSYTYKIVYELTERLTDDQLAAMHEVLQRPWTPPPGYDGQMIKAKILREYCDSDPCSECLECKPVASDFGTVSREECTEYCADFYRVEFPSGVVVLVFEGPGATVASDRIAELDL